MQRRPTRELLDTDAGTPAEITGSLRDLRSFNEWLGGVTTTREMVRRVASVTRRNEFSLLEVAAGDGFVPHRVAQDLSHAGIKLRSTLLDRSRAHLPRNGSVPKIAADSLRLPFAGSSFDLVSCSLFLHHLSSEEIVQFAKESLRVARVAVLVNDLIRHPLHLALAYAGMPLYRSRITRHDAPASVKQAYTTNEMKALLLGGGASNTHVETHHFFRMGVIAWK
jgi:ubiquinone/menaquinone biosynthesis C-methylase UbiE